MGEVALTNIRYGAKGKHNSDGTYTEISPTQTIDAGAAIPGNVFSKEELQSLRDNGAIGDASQSPSIALGSTSSQLQSAEAEAMAPPAGELTEPASAPTEDALAEALDAATNQVDRHSKDTKESKKG